MKKVLYISYDGMTDQLGQSQVIPYLRELTKRGYQFTILSVEKKERLKKNGETIRRLLDETGIAWETLVFTKHPPVLSKLYDQYKLNARAIRLHKSRQFDIVHCRSYVAAAAGFKITRRFGIPFLFDMRGFWVDERVDSGLWNLKNQFHNFLYKIYKKKEKEYFSESAHLISLTKKGKEELVNVYQVPSNKISIIPCCADLDHFDYRKISEEKKQQLKEQLQISNDSIVLSYLGSLGGWYMVDEMLDFFTILRKKNPSAVFLFITHGSQDQIISKAALKGINADAIRVQPASRVEVPLYLSISDWSVFFIKDLYSKRASSPTKQGEIMAMGIPIICNDIGDTGTILKETGSGVVIDKFDNASYNIISDQLENLLQLNKEHIRQSAKKYYDLENGVIAYEKVYREIEKIRG